MDQIDQVVQDFQSSMNHFPTVESNFMRYAIPIGDGQKRAFFGLTPSQGGATVSVVAPYGSAARAGLQKGDLVTDVNGQLVNGLDQAALDGLLTNNTSGHWLVTIQTADGKSANLDFSSRDIRWYLSHPLEASSP
jgi:S1-C subfamily serine protease